ncbi:hypothetical protein BG005_003132, partial [Podila minutissima]
ARIKVLDEFLVRHDVNVPEILHEERCDMDFEIEEEDKPITIRFPETNELDLAITKRDLLLRNVEVIKEIGSEDQKETWKSWQGKFKRTSSQNSVLHVKIYTTKSNLHHEEIKMKQMELDILTVELVEAKKLRDSHAAENESKKQPIKEIVNHHHEGMPILGFVTNEALAPNVFNALMVAEAYIGDTAVCVKKVQAVYMKLAQIESTSSPDSPTSRSPTNQMKSLMG